MSAVRATKKPNLLLCLDAFGTLFIPSTPIPAVYAQAAARHGIDCGGDKDASEAVGASFKKAFKAQSKQNPNYGKAAGLGPSKWWGNVIRHTFEPFLKQSQEVPSVLVNELLETYSTKRGYRLYDDVNPLFRELRKKAQIQSSSAPFSAWDQIVVGIITNSDDRVPGVLNSFGLEIGPRRVGTADTRSKEACLKDDVSFVVLSYDVGVEKPDRRIFYAAVDMLEDTIAGNNKGLTTESFEKLYVGDDVEKDYEGAKAAGWHSLLLKRGSDTGEHNDTAEADTIKSLAQLGSFDIGR